MSEPKTSLPLHYPSRQLLSRIRLLSAMAMSHLVVNAQGELAVGIGHLGGISEAVDRQAAYAHG